MGKITMSSHGLDGFRYVSDLHKSRRVRAVVRNSTAQRDICKRILKGEEHDRFGVQRSFILIGYRLRAATHLPRNVLYRVKGAIL